MYFPNKQLPLVAALVFSLPFAFADEGMWTGPGFDTATEIGVLAISAVGAAQGLPIWTILIFPALFTAGMTLIDTTDSIMMLGAYGWAPTVGRL